MHLDSVMVNVAVCFDKINNLGVMTLQDFLGPEKTHMARLASQRQFVFGRQVGQTIQMAGRLSQRGDIIFGTPQCPNGNFGRIIGHADGNTIDG